MRKKVLSVILCGALAASMLAGCGTYTENTGSSTVEADSTQVNAAGGTDAAAASQATTLNISGGVAVTLNVFTTQSSNDADCFYLLTSSLFRYYNDEIQNDACESYEVSEDGLVYTFHLRDGLAYSDGTPITSADFAYFLEHDLDPATGAAQCYYYYGISGAYAYNSGESDWDSVGVKCVDDATLEITLETADNAFVKMLALQPIYPITPEFVAQWGDSLGSSPESMLCSGPYTLTEWTVDTSMTFEKNENWWNAANEFPMQTVHVLDVESDNTEISMFENGELDILSKIDTNYIGTLGDAVGSYESSTEMYLWMKEVGTSDAATACMNNDNFRKALVYALDRTAIGSAIDAGFIGTNRAVSSNYPGIDGKYIDEYAVDTCPTAGDAALANEYMAAALAELGYSDVSELPDLSYMTFERDDMKLLGETITDTWKQVLGIDNITFTQYPIATAIQSFYTGDYDMFMISVGCSIRPTDTIECFTPDGDYGFFTENWTADIVEDLAAANAYEFGSADYLQAVSVAEEELLNEYSLVPLYNQTIYYALADGVEGYVPGSTSYNFQINHLTVTK